MKQQVHQLINQQNFSEARKLCKKLCARSGEDAESLFLMGAIHGQLGEFSAAEKVLRKAFSLAPNHPILNFNLGVSLFHLRKYQEAIEFLVRCVQLYPQHFEAWMFLGQACDATGVHENAIKSYEQARALQPSSAEVLKKLGENYLALQQWPLASDIYSQLIEINGEDAQTVNKLGIALSRAYQYDRLIKLLEPRAMSRPMELESNYYVAMAYMEQGEIDQALTYFERVLAAHPEHIESITGIATIHNFKGHYQQAMDTISPLVDSHPENSGVALVFAAIAPRFDRADEATRILRAQLNNNQVSDFTKAKVAVALGALYDKASKYDEAFASIQHGNSLNNIVFDRANHIKSIEVLEHLYSKDAVASLPSSGYSGQKPIFILGMPRSGTTLIEQILASHSQVFGAGELKYIQNYCFELHDQHINGKSYPQCLADVSAEELSRLADDYCGHLDRLSSGAPRVTDKMPNNFLHLGLIYQLFPQAKIIHCIRNPMDTCVSCYSQFFSGAYPYTYDLGDLGFYYRSYERLMKHWHAVLPLSIMDVSYEELVQNQEPMTRKILKFCDLDWEDSCLEFHKTQRAVATASTDQVRQPMYTGAIEKWRRYEKHLDKLVKSLEEYK